MPGIGIYIKDRLTSGVKTFSSTLPVGTTDIIVGNSLTDTGIFITYNALRGAQWQTGTIEITSPYTDLVNSPPVVNFNGTDIGLTFTASLSGNNILLNCIVDNSSADAVTFNYVVEVVKGTKTMNMSPDGDPSDLTLTVPSDTEIELNWTSGSTNEDGFNIYISSNGTDFSLFDTSTTNTFSATGLTEASRYYFKVTAFKGIVESNYTNTENSYTLPVPPSNLTLIAVGSTEIDLSFTVNSSNRDGHSIERSVDDINYAEIATVSGATATYNDTGLTASTLYYYRVRAYKSTSFSDYTFNASYSTFETETSAYLARFSSAL